MHAFSRLCKTELRSRRNTLILVIIITALIQVMLALLPGMLELATDQLGFIVTLNIFIYAVAMFFTLLYCFTIWTEEWRNRTIHHLLSIPIPRAYLLLSKFTAVLLEIVLITCVMAVGMSLQNGLQGGLLFRAEPLITLDVSKVIFILQLLIGCTDVVLLGFFSTLMGKWFSKASVIIMFLVFIGGLFLSVLFIIQVPDLLALVIVGLAVFAGSLYLLDKKIEVSA